MLCIALIGLRTVRSVEEYRDENAPEQEIFQNSEGQCWDSCTVSALFPAEASLLTRYCTASVRVHHNNQSGHVAVPWLRHMLLWYCKTSLQCMLTP